MESVEPLFHSGGALNFIGYKNAEVDRLLDTAKKTADYRAYKELMKMLEAVLARDLPYAFLWMPDVYSAVSRRVENVTLAPYRYFTDFREWRPRPSDP